MMNIIRVKAAVLDTTQLILYREDGTSLSIPQGDPRVASIVKGIMPVISRGEIAIVNLGASEDPAPLPPPPVKVDTSNPYSDYEKSSNGLVRFFRVAKTAVQRLFAPTNLNPQVIGVIPVNVPPHLAVTPSDNTNHPVLSQEGFPGHVPEELRSQLPVPEPVKTEQENKVMSVVDEIMSHAKTVPASDPTFVQEEVGKGAEHTIVAVVGDQVIPGMEAIKPQITRANELGSTKGLDAFMKRLAAVAAQRQHTAQELLTFLKRGDLPLADDGSIVIYKVLRRNTEEFRQKDFPNHSYVDCHSRKVPQREGSFVMMDEKLVDRSRHTECSVGLHVARRKYLSFFNGDVCVLAKVAPEDVVAVPYGEPDKMRVAGYHILFELPEDAYAKLRSNQPFTTTEKAQILLGRALSGDHPPPMEEVRITGSYGEGVIVTALNRTEPVNSTTEVAKAPIKAQAIPEKLINEQEPAPKPLKIVKPKPVAPAVDPKTVAQAAAKAKAVTESRADKALRLYAEFSKAKSKAARKQAAQALLDHKKAVKLGWTALQINPDIIPAVEEAAKG